MERLQKIIAKSGLASRRKAEEMIQEGRITVNGKVITELGYKVNENDKIQVDSIDIENETLVYYLFNKPSGCISAVSDDKDRKVVVDYFREKGVKERIFPVGRLDYDTTGALILTNDGELANLLMHPKNEIDKTYLVRCEGIVNSGDISKLKRGIQLEGYKTAPAIADILSIDREHNSSQVRIIIHEGRYHQVKLMFEAIGHPVKKLRREKYSFLGVEGLKPGEFRRLKIQEVKYLFVLANKEREQKHYTLRKKGVR